MINHTENQEITGGGAGLVGPGNGRQYDQEPVGDVMAEQAEDGGVSPEIVFPSKNLITEALELHSDKNPYHNSKLTYDRVVRAAKLAEETRPNLQGQIRWDSVKMAIAWQEVDYNKFPDRPEVVRAASLDRLKSEMLKNFTVDIKLFNSVREIVQAASSSDFDSRFRSPSAVILHLANHEYLLGSEKHCKDSLQRMYLEYVEFQEKYNLVQKMGKESEDEYNPLLKPILTWSKWLDKIKDDILGKDDQSGMVPKHGVVDEIWAEVDYLGIKKLDVDSVVSKNLSDVRNVDIPRKALNRKR